ncbi:MAG: D-glycerate dehydrogenase [Deltaproteobacteria bacterium]|nr:D-glycerate dehydrogenase [Deltaproteobacteria bacterium]
MAKPNVFVTRMIAQEALDMIARETQMEVWPGELPPAREVLLDKARDAEGLLTLLTDLVDARLMDSAPNLKVISNYAVGYDNVDIGEAGKRGIVVGNTPGVLAETTADMAFALLMASARRVAEGRDYTMKGHWKTWSPMVLLGQDIHGATLGIIGLGRIGAEVARRARGFNMRVLYHGPHRKSEQLEKELGVEYVPELKDILASADFISVHVPLTPSTEGLIGAAEFQLMKKNAVFINTARGGIVDQKALYEALRSGQIFAAGLDVTSVEPIPLDDPLLTLSNVIITPHIASASVKTREKMAMMAAENLLAGIKGELPPNCVNPEAFKS